VLGFKCPERNHLNLADCNIRHCPCIQQAALPSRFVDPSVLESIPTFLVDALAMRCIFPQIKHRVGTKSPMTSRTWDIRVLYTSRIWVLNLEQHCSDIEQKAAMS
jgi:hypothetical protein